MFFDNLQNTINYAYEKHQNQFRKASKIPYIVHPFEVMSILLRERENDSIITEDLIIAGLLHDVNEDSNVSFEEIERKFGKKVRDYVFNVSEPEHLRNDCDCKLKSWKARKEHTINSIKKLDKGSKYLLCADKLANLNSIFNDMFSFEKEDEEKVWCKFNAPKEEIKWYYSSCIKELKEIENSLMYKRICFVYYNVFKEKVC